MQFSEFIQWAFLGLVSGGVYILWRMNQNMSDLNTKIAVILERTNRHEVKIDSHDERIRNLELIK